MEVTTPLFVIKKRNAEKYQTGCHSYAAPKIYTRKADAFKVCKKNNERYYSSIESLNDHNKVHAQAVRVSQFSDVPVSKFISDYMQQNREMLERELEEGEWVIAEVALQIVKIL